MSDQDYISLLCELIAIPSFSGEEGSAADRLCSFLKTHKVEFERIGNNVIAYNRGFVEGRPAVVLNSHLDTVKPTEGWQQNPFLASVNGDKITGLGSNDAGGSLVSLLAAFIDLNQYNLPTNLVFIASAEEENSGDGGIRLVLKDISFDIDIAIIGEPTGLRAAIAEKGLLVVDGIATGKTGHAARPNKSNAIDMAVHDIIAINSLHFNRVSETLGPVIKSVTQINAGTQHNVIPDKCTFVIDVRVNELYSLKEVHSILQAVCKSKLVARSFKNRPSALNPDHAFNRVLRDLEIEKFGSPTLSDQAHFNCPTVKIGPGLSARSHTADEFIYGTEIHNGIDLYTRMLKQYFNLKA